MENEVFKILYEVLEDCEFQPRAYSGRSMYGTYCLGVSCSNPMSALVQICQAIASSDDHKFDLFEIIANPQSDNLGRDYILYFPDVEWQDDEEESEEN